MALKLTG